MRTGLEDAKRQASRPRSPFASPEFIMKLATDPRTKGFLQQPDFMRMLSDVQANPANMNMYLQDPRFQLVRLVVDSIHKHK